MKQAAPRIATAIVSNNIEGISATKVDLLQDIYKKHKIDVLCVQETHGGMDMKGTKMILERPHRQHGSAIFVRPEITVLTSELKDNNSIKILTIELSCCLVPSIYKPPDTLFQFNTLNILKNSHCTIWGYENDNENEEAVLRWSKPAT